MQSIDPVVKAVRNLIKYRGGPVSMVVEKPGKYNPATSKVEVVRESYTPHALVLDAKESIAASSLIQTGDKQLFILPDAMTPKPVTTITEFKIQGEVFKVYLVKELNTNDVNPIYYEVYARR